MIHGKPGNRLYYYCSLETALNHILKHNQLLLSPIISTNDPRENKNFDFATTSMGNIDHTKVGSEISKAVRENCKVLCFTKEPNKSIWGFELSRMWAYYGARHKGVCLLLDKQKFLEENKHFINPKLFKEINYYEFDIDDPYLEPKMVDYIKMAEIGKKKYLDEIFIPDNVDYLYFTKNKEWDSEHEIRLIHHSENQENEYCSIIKSLHSIYLGVDFEKSNLASLINLCPHINIFSLEYKHVKLIPLLSYKAIKD